MKIVFLWANISGYMAACWRELSYRNGLDLFVLAREPKAMEHTEFDSKIMNHVPWKGVDRRDLLDYNKIKGIVAEQDPDMIVFCGWNLATYREVAFDADFAGVKRILFIDNPRISSIRQFFGRIKLAHFVRRMDGVFVCGERSWQLARYYLFPEEKIFRGTYGIDFNEFSQALEQRLALPGGWPKKFIFIGQFIPRKGLDLLVDAYSIYRNKVSDPWPLECCGKGALSSLLYGKPGITDRGFCQPDVLRDLMGSCGVFVLPSLLEHWGVAIVEACASGLPVICSEACGASVEVIRSCYNGLTVPTNSVQELSKALFWMHENYSDLPYMGNRSQKMACPYAAHFWATRFLRACYAL